MSEIVLKKATVVYNQGTSSEVPALVDVNLLIEDGDFVSIVGSNGSGKSTLLKAVSGGVPLTKGKVWVDGKNVTALKSFKRLREVSMVYQSPNDSVAMGMTVQENLTLAILKGKKLTLGIPRSTRNEIIETLERLKFNLVDKLEVSARELSGGQKQLLNLAMAVMQRPKILLLDEHTAALDPINREQMNKLTLTIAHEQKLTTLMVSHSVKDALSMGNRLIVLNEGRVMLDADHQRKAQLRPTDLEQLTAAKQTSETLSHRHV